MTQFEASKDQQILNLMEQLDDHKMAIEIHITTISLLAEQRRLWRECAKKLYDALEINGGSMEDEEKAFDAFNELDQPHLKIGPKPLSKEKELQQLLNEERTITDRLAYIVANQNGFTRNEKPDEFWNFASPKTRQSFVKDTMEQYNAGLHENETPYIL